MFTSVHLKALYTLTLALNSFSKSICLIYKISSVDLVAFIVIRPVEKSKYLIVHSVINLNVS